MVLGRLPTGRRPGPSSAAGPARYGGGAAEEAPAEVAQDLPVVAAGQGRRRLAVLGRAIGVEHLLLNDVHASSLDPWPRARPWIDLRRQSAPGPVPAPLTMEG